MPILGKYCCTKFLCRFIAISQRGKEGGLGALAVAGGLVPLSDDGDQVALLCVIHCVVQCVQTVGDLHELCVRVALVHAFADIRNNVLYLFKAVVVLGEDGEIGYL